MSDNPRVWYHTFGCKANQYDTERMRQEIESRGARTAFVPDDAEVAVINTCTVTNQADANARRLIRRLRRERPDMRIVVAGCSTALREADYVDMPETDGVVAGQDPLLVAGALAQAGLVPESAAGTGPLDRNVRGTRGWLKVQDGCDRQCSFCATRVARGASISRSVDEVVEEASALAIYHPELVITGIHIGHYGHDLGKRTTLSRLCARLLESVDARIRLSSIEATEIDDLIIELMRESDGQLAPHLHIPMQSGSDAVLRMMRRWHTREAYRTRVREIAEAVEPIGLGADIIVGFPGESDAHHAETRRLVEELPFTYLHVFPYSVRDRTVAASLPDRVPGDVAAARSRELREIALEKGEAYRRARAGGVADVIVEQTGDPEIAGTDTARAGSTSASALTGDYLRVRVPGAVTAGERFTTELELDGNLLVARKPEASHSAA